jgi:hypothetical protein
LFVRELRLHWVLGQRSGMTPDPGRLLLAPLRWVDEAVVPRTASAVACRGLLVRIVALSHLGRVRTRGDERNVA